MSRVEIAENHVRRMSRRDLAAFRRWFARFDAEAWDRQIETDAAAGKFSARAAKALAAHRRGESREL
jgi:hypothetical protein